jgi:hypothetical protein
MDSVFIPTANSFAILAQTAGIRNQSDWISQYTVGLLNTKPEHLTAFIYACTAGTDYSTIQIHLNELPDVIEALQKALHEITEYENRERVRRLTGKP